MGTGAFTQFCEVPKTKKAKTSLGVTQLWLKYIRIIPIYFSSFNDAILVEFKGIIILGCNFAKQNSQKCIQPQPYVVLKVVSD